jgi:gluconate 2-dehydrogenase gamma chain
VTGALRTLTERQRITLEAAACRVLPSNDGPGAREADAVAFIEWMTRQPCFDRRWPSFLAGLQLLDDAANSRHGAPFHACPAAIQDALLAGLTTVPHATVRWFFAMLVRLTVTGFLSPPGYPGNRGGVGWQYMGYSSGPRHGDGDA